MDIKLELDTLKYGLFCDSEGFCVQSLIQQWFTDLVDNRARSSRKHDTNTRFKGPSE